MKYTSFGGILLFALLFTIVLASGSMSAVAASRDISVQTAYSYNMSTYEVTAQITISGSDIGKVTEYGIISSFSEYNPYLDNSGNEGCSYIPVPITSVTTSETNFYISFFPKIPNGLPISSALYIRAYAKDDSYIYYSDTFTINNLFALSTHVSSISRVSESSVDIGIRVSEVDPVIIQEWGVIYSKSYTQLVEKEGNDLYYYHALKSNQLDTVVNLTDLEPNTTYYIQSFVLGNEPHPGYTYSLRIDDFTTLAKPSLTINPVTTLSGVAYNSAQFSGRLNFNGVTDIIEKGFVYSDMLNNPTIYDSAFASHPNAAEGDFNMTISGLTPGSGYYVRAYAKNSAREYIYSDVQMFYTELSPAVKEKPYMTGIDQYMFGPNNNGTYMEVATMLYSLLADPNKTYSPQKRFSDVDYSDELTSNIVNFVSSKGYMAGSDTGLFLSNNPISRASVAVIICEVMGLMHEYSGPMPIPSAFTDTDNHWSRGYVFVAAMRGILNGYNENGVMMFKPEGFVSKAELAVVFSNMFDRSGEPMSDLNFVDVPTDHWAYKYIMNAAIPSY